MEEMEENKKGRRKDILKSTLKKSKTQETQGVSLRRMPHPTSQNATCGHDTRNAVMSQ